MYDEPGPDEILAAAARFLRSEVLPALPPDLAFKTRVLANALDLVGRQMSAGDGPAAAARVRLAALVGQEGAEPDLTALLAGQIESGALAPDDPALLRHLWATTLAKIAVDQPGYASYRAELAAPKTIGE